MIFQEFFAFLIVQSAFFEFSEFVDSVELWWMIKGAVLGIVRTADSKDFPTIFNKDLRLFEDIASQNFL